MESFNFLVAVILIFLAVQYGQPWIVFAILILSILTIKSFKAVAGLVASSVIFYLLMDYGEIQTYFPLLILGIVIIGIILGIGKGQDQSQTYPGGYSDLLGGGGGAGEGLGY